MFEWLAEFDRILVTGPHRAGTRIATQMIAYDTGHRYIDEGEVKMDSLYTLRLMFESQRRFVVQCPSLCRYAHYFSAEDAAIVLMRRPVADVVASQNRIHWGWESLELMRYNQAEGPIAEVKYRYWDEYQKERILHPFEVDYDTLKAHPLWLAKDHRAQFDATQTVAKEDDFALDPNTYLCPHADSYLLEQSEETGSLVKLKQPPQELNPTAQLAWQLCDGTRTFQEITREFRAQFDDAVDEETLVADLQQVVRRLLRLNFIHRSAVACGQRQRDEKPS